MKVMFACLCDHAAADSQGKLSVNGIFDRINAPGFPTRHGKMFLVFRLMFEYEDNDKAHSFTFSLVDADNRKYLEAEADLQHPRVLPGQFLTFNQIVELNDVVIAKPGRYTFVLEADGQEAFRVPFDAGKA